jgi:hypothetical protein
MLVGYRTAHSAMTLGVGVDHVVETDSPFRTAVSLNGDLGELVLTVDAVVRYHGVECNDWILEAAGGALYAPRALPEAYEVEGARVRARIRVRAELLGFCPGRIVDVLEIAPAPCLHTCGAAPPPVSLRVVDAATGAAVDGVTVTFLAAPEPQPGAAPLAAACAPGPEVTTCSVYGPGAGRYELEVRAPGFLPAAIAVEVAAVAPLPGACCALAYDEQTVDVALEPAP